MRLNKGVQYGLLFSLYLARSGRCSVAVAAKSLRLSPTFLGQIAVKLKNAGVVSAVKGPAGGYSLAGDPSVRDVINAISPMVLISLEDVEMFTKGPPECRAVVNFVTSLNREISLKLKRRIRNVMSDLVTLEVSILNSMPETGVN